ncbi:MAG: ribosome maturation factor RimM, partial [Bacteroidota bacterium]
MAGAFVEIGYTKKTHGVQGWLRVQVEPEYLEDFLATSAVFLRLQGQPVPYFVESFDARNDLLIKLEDIDSKEAAARLSGKALSLREQDIIPDHEREFELAEEELVFSFLTGFQVQTEVQGVLGTILEILEFPQQEMARLEVKEKDILIPLHEDFIQSINEDQKQITM